MEHINDDMVQEGFCITQHFYTDTFIDEIIEQLDGYNALQFSKQKRSDFNLLTYITSIKELTHTLA